MTIARLLRGALLVAFGVVAPAVVPSAWAATFPDFFVVSVPVNPDAANRRADAIRRGMSTLVTRVTGQRGAADDPRLQPLLDAAPGLVTSYGQLADERIRVGFNGAAVESRLADLGLPWWGAERPAITLWVAIDFGDGQRAMLTRDGVRQSGPGLTAANADLIDGIRDELLAAADERGLPVTLPLMDQRDFGMSSFASVWGGFASALYMASERYAADYVLIATILLTDFGLEIEWSLSAAGDTPRRLVTSTPRDGIDWVADQFAMQFSSSGGLRQLRLEITGVDSLAEYGTVLSYLEGLSIVESVDVTTYAQARLGLIASIRADDVVLERVFDLGGVLEADLPAFGDFLPAGGRRFRLVNDAAR